MEIEYLEEALFREWEEHLKKRMSPEDVQARMCWDGLHFTGAPVKNDCWTIKRDQQEEGLWKNAKLRPLFLTKDYNSREEPPQGADIRDETGLDNDTDEVYYQFYARYLLFLFGLTHIDMLKGTCPPIEEAEDPDNYMENFFHTPVVRMNLKKIAGGNTCPEYILRKYIKEDEFFIRRQIGLYNANIIICCDGSIWTNNPMKELMESMYPDMESVKKENGEASYNLYYSAKSKIIIIHEYHPSTRKYGYEDFYDPIPELAEYLHKHPDAIG